MTREIIIKDTHRGLWYEDGVLARVLTAGRYELPRPGWLPSGGFTTCSSHGGVFMSCAAMLRARASWRAAPSWPRSAATECSSSMLAFIIVSTDDEPGR